MRFKDRIALQYLWATALLMALAFLVVYLVTAQVVFSNLDADLDYEAEKHTYEVEIKGDSIHFYNKAEWEEREHREVQVNPVFIQVIDLEGRVMDKSPNLKEGELVAHFPARKEHFDSELNTQQIRQVQWPLEENGELKGYILAAMSSESALSILSGLAWVLFWIYLFLVATLFFFSRQLAARNIKPVELLSDTVQKIGRFHLSERVPLPPNQDEIHQLSSRFNELLDRIESALQREREFTSDASHELRTPLASLRGTLEVLIRRERSPEEYQSKIQYCLQEIDRMTEITDHLLTLARIEQSDLERLEEKALSAILEELVTGHSQALAAKDIEFSLSKDFEDLTLPEHQASLILGNLLSNAIKYNRQGAKIEVQAYRKGEQFHIRLSDQGFGIKAEEQKHIFQSFYRGEESLEKQIKGNGLGLAIAQKAAQSMGWELSLVHSDSSGSIFQLSLSKN